MRHRLLAGLALVMIAGLAAGCVGHGRAVRSSKHGGWHGKSSRHVNLEQKFFYKAHMVLSHQQALGLSEEQVNTIKTLKHETKKTIIQQRATVDMMALDLKVALKADPADRRQVTQLIDKKYGMKSDKAKTLATAYITLKSILTLDQKEQLKTLWREKKGTKGKCSKAGCSVCRR